MQQGVSPYDGSLCHTPPLFIAFLHTLDSFNEIHSDQVKAILLITLDLVASVFLYFFVCQEQLRRSRVSQPKKSTSAPDVVDNSSIPLLVAGFYLLNPMSVMTCIALSVGQHVGFLLIYVLYSCTCSLPWFTTLQLLWAFILGPRVELSWRHSG